MRGRMTVHWILGIFILLCASGFALHGNIAREESRLGTVSIEGLKRTKETVVRSIIALEEGAIITDEKLQRVEQDLLKSGIFSSVVVQRDDDALAKTTDITVHLTEKWSLIPVPYFASDGSSLSGGVFLIESNLLGYNTFLLSALYGGTESGLRGLLVFSNPSLAGSAWSLSAIGGFGRTTVTNELPDGTRIRSYETNYMQMGVGLGYAWNSLIRTEGRVRFRDWNLISFTGGLDTHDLSDMRYGEPEITLRYENTRLSHVLLVGTSVSVSGRTIVPHGGWELSGAFTWSMPLQGNHRLQVLISGGYGDMPALAETSIGAQDGYRTLPFQNSTADRWASASARYDIPLYFGSWGVPVITPYWETGVYATELFSAHPFYGPGVGFRVYLRRIALPALGADIAYNVPDDYWSFSITVGMPM